MSYVIFSSIWLKANVKTLYVASLAWNANSGSTPAIELQTQKSTEKLSGLSRSRQDLLRTSLYYAGSGHSDNKFIMLLDWTTGPLAEGLRCYQKQEFFDAHEHWEVVWLQCNEPEKTFLQALIQITAAFHHLKRGNLAGTASLLRRASRHLEDFPAEYEGVAVERLRVSIRGWLEALALEQALLQLPLPLIR